MIKHPMVEKMTRTIRRKNGKLIIHNDVFKLKEEYQGNKIGLGAFARQVENAHKEGVSHIETYAARQPGETYVDKDGVVKERWAGYYVWPRYRYYGPLDGRMRAAILSSELAPPLKAATDIRELMADDAGRRGGRQTGRAWMSSSTWNAGLIR